MEWLNFISDPKILPVLGFIVLVLMIWRSFVDLGGLKADLKNYLKDKEQEYKEYQDGVIEINELYHAAMMKNMHDAKISAIIELGRSIEGALAEIQEDVKKAEDMYGDQAGALNRIQIQHDEILHTLQRRIKFYVDNNPQGKENVQ